MGEAARAAAALDRLRCDLDDAWPGGCSAKRMAGPRHHIGLGRVMAGAARVVPGLPVPRRRVGAYYAFEPLYGNLYLKLLTRGGH